MGMMDEAIPDRYEKNPMLAVVENFVLDAIGKLEAEKAVLLNEMICRTFGGTDWRKVVREQLDLPAETEAQLREAWVRRQVEAEVKQEDLAAEDFAREVADELFAGRG